MSYKEISLKPRIYVAQSDAIQVDKSQHVASTQNPSESKQEENVTLKNVLKNIDVDELTKKYKKKPLGVFDELEIHFTKDEKETLGVFISDKKSLKSFLNFAKEQELTKQDIVEGFKKLNEMAPSGFWKRVGNFFKTIFDDGLAEAFKLAKSEKEYRSEKMSETMVEIRIERKDLEAFTLANIAKNTTEKPQIKQNTMHFVTKKDGNGNHIYSENAVVKANNYMYENVEKADKFTANAVELELIKGPNNTIKYSGDTIVNVSTRMTEKPELKSTMMAVGKKSDMTNEYFDGITDNLFKNPHMESTISFMATAVNEDGTDRFSAGNVHSSSVHLSEKNKTYCSSYYNNIMTLAQYQSISGDDIVKLNAIATSNPAAKNQIIELCKQNPSNLSQIIQKYEQKYSYTNSNQKEFNAVSTPQVNDSNTNNNGENYITTKLNEKYKNAANGITNTITRNVQDTPISAVHNEENITQKTNINGQEYSRTVVLDALYKKYGEHSEKILQHLEENPQFIELIKKYGNNKKLVAALVENPQIINQLKTASSSLTTNELTEMVELCHNQKTLNMMKELTKKYLATEAIKMIKSAKLNNLLSETNDILNVNTTDAKTKKEEINNLITKRKPITC